MSAQIPSAFGSYDLFAKAFPGTAFLLFAISLLPEEAFNADFAQSGALIAAVTLFVLVLGFAFGQALHSISVWVEKKFYAVSKWWYRTSLWIQNIFYNIYQIVTELFGYEAKRTGRDLIVVNVFILLVLISFIVASLIFSPESASSLKDGLILGFITSFTFIGPLSYISLITRVRRWVRQTLIPHRRQFGQELSYSDDKNNDEVWLQRSFIDQIDEKYQTESGTMDGSAVNLLYTLVMSYLAHNAIGRARQFQAVFAFCRSMWVTLFLYSICYFFIGLRYSQWSTLPFFQIILNSVINYRPIILSQIAGGEALTIAGIVFFLLGFFFMEGERQYKSLFVDYVMADFLTITAD